MAELVEIEQEDARPLLEEMLEDLHSITNKWREVGEVLNVSRATLDELQSHSKGANINDKNNFEVVMKEWIEKNTSTYMWAPLLQILKNNDFPLDYERLTEAHCPLANADGEHQKIIAFCGGVAEQNVSLIFQHTVIDLLIKISHR